jgi:hypothetical protein
MPLIKFKDVGPNKRSWEKEMPFAHCDKIAREAKKTGGLMSREIDAAYDENADLNPKCEGTIYVGVFRAVGRFEVVK